MAKAAPGERRCVYDSYGRVAEVKVNGVTQYAYTYDADPLGGGSYPAGRLSTVSYGAGIYTLTEKYAYTRGGLVTKKRLEVASGSKKGNLDVDLTYDTLGRVTTEGNPGWGAMAYEFDAMGRPNKMTGGGGGPG
ncbi:MAG: hypothetical protein KIT09_07115 [Bryobacteraceae bacterium]|nr:hypothetical protein [Bryobacteraceae bacterium]